MRWLIEALKAFFAVLLPFLAERSKPSAEEGRKDRPLRDKLRRRVRRTWGWLLLALLPLTGCPGGAPFTRTIYVPDGEPVRLRATIRNAPVWVKGADGQPVPGKMTLPEGWYCLPVPDEE